MYITTGSMFSLTTERVKQNFSHDVTLMAEKIKLCSFTVRTGDTFNKLNHFYASPGRERESFQFQDGCCIRFKLKLYNVKK